MTEFEKLLFEEIKGMRKDLRKHCDDDRLLEKRVIKLESKILLISTLIIVISNGGKITDTILKLL